MSAGDQPLRSRAEVAAELGVSERRVGEAAWSLRGRIVTVAGERNGKRDGRVRLYGPQAVDAIREQVKRDQARRRRAEEEGAGYWRALAGLRIAVSQFGKLAGALYSAYRALRDHPPMLGATIHTLPDRRLALTSPPVVALVSPVRRSTWRAVWPEAGLEAKGKGQLGALAALRQEMVHAYLALRESPEQDAERWAVLEELIRERQPRRRKAQMAGLAGQRELGEAAAPIAEAEQAERPSRLAMDERRDA